MADTDNLNQGRNFVVPPQVDADGNSIITGKKPVNAQQIQQAQSDAYWERIRTDPLDKNPDKVNRNKNEQPNWDWTPNEADRSLVVAKPAAEKVLPRPPEDTQEQFAERMAQIWTPNPSDLTPPPPAIHERQPGQPHNVVRPLEEPDFNWNPLTGAEGYVKPDIEIPTRPHYNDVAPVTEPDFGWNPQRKLIAMGDAAIAKIQFKVGDVLNPSIFFEKTVSNDELEYSVDNANVTLAPGTMTAAKEGKVSLTASIVNFPQFSRTITLEVIAP
ncbi:hypothetical protein GJ904_17760 [Salmonella enterica]|nr:hypothetical protein [Salmonella enterica subsp. enterica serovar Saintpaul]EEC1302919.1 hypothetical protein [Salmonella enterica]